jgi:3-oxoacyl-[acyl-carrier-protein] synthase-1
MTAAPPSREIAAPAVIGTGARTCVGASAAGTAAAVRAGVAGFAQHPFMVDTAGNKMIVAMAPFVDPAVAGAQRLADLAIPAAAEALTALPAAVRAQPLPVILALPPARPARPTDAEKLLTERLRLELSDLARIGSVETIAAGHAAGAMALEAAWRRLQQPGAQFCLAGGVDSYLEPETLEWLEANEQVHSAGALNNAWGFVPGEAAGFCLLASAAAVQRFGLTAPTRLVAAATARESKLIKTEAVCIGEGLTALFRALFRAVPDSPGKVDHVYCDMNGEPYRSDEFGFASVRTATGFAEGADFTTPADCWGDVGAASAPLFAILADAAARRGYARGSWQLIWTSSESGERSGAILHAARATGGTY